MQQLVSELNLKHRELDSAEAELVAWKQHQENGIAGVLSLSVRSVKALDGKELEPSAFVVQVQEQGVDDGEASLTGVAPADPFALAGAKAIADPFSLPLANLQRTFKIIVHEKSVKAPLSTAEGGTDDSENAAENEESDPGASLDSEPSVKSVPYVAIYDANGAPSDTTERSDLQALCTETGETVVLSVTSLFDLCDGALVQKAKEVEEIKASIGELEKALKSGGDSNRDKASSGSAGASGVASPKKEKKKKTKSPQSGGLTFAQGSKVAVALLLEHRSYLLFAGAAAFIYCFGDNASV